MRGTVTIDTTAGDTLGTFESDCPVRATFRNSESLVPNNIKCLCREVPDETEKHDV